MISASLDSPFALMVDQPFIRYLEQVRRNGYRRRTALAWMYWMFFSSSVGRRVEGIRVDEVSADSDKRFGKLSGLTTCSWIVRSDQCVEGYEVPTDQGS